MGCFRWISSWRLPPEFDLRSRGWHLARAGEFTRSDCVGLADAGAITAGRSLPPPQRSRTLALGIDDSRERAFLLACGFGDVLASDSGIDEVAARAGRLLVTIGTTVRRQGRLTLDLLARQAAVDGRPLRLFPREFALLWRLSSEPGVAVARADLLRDVLGLTIEPGTNALAVHICRLRRKLHAARLSHLLVTGPGSGGYALLFDADLPQEFGRRNPLDDAAISGEEMALIEEAAK